jgi:hypothetical protein
MNKHIKIMQKGFAGYNGQIGQYSFVDGVSTEAMPMAERDRMAAVFQFVELEEDGTETPCGAAHRLVRDSALRAPVAEPLARMTEAEKTAEEVEAVVAAHDAKDRPTHSLEELEAILKEGGVSGLREVGELWNVKNRSAVVLIQMILDAQAAYKAGAAARLAERVEALTAAGEVAEEEAALVEAEAPVTEPEPEATVDDAQAELLKAAMSGDLGAGLVIDGPIVAEKIEPGVVVADTTDEAKE